MASKKVTKVPEKVEEAPVEPFVPNNFLSLDGNCLILRYKPFDETEKDVSKVFNFKHIKDPETGLYIVGDHTTKFKGSTGSYDKYNYQGWDSDFKVMPNNNTGCKDYINDWCYAIANTKSNDFDTRFRHGAIFNVIYPTITTMFTTIIKKAMLSTRKFLEEIRYENPDDLKFLLINATDHSIYIHLSKRLMTMPAVVSGIFMLIRNSYMYEEGLSIQEYLTAYIDSAKRNIESSRYSSVIAFVKLFSEEEDINSIFPKDPKLSWHSTVAWRSCIHGAFGIDSFISYKIHDMYRKLINDAKTPKEVAS